MILKRTYYYSLTLGLLAIFLISTSYSKQNLPETELPKSYLHAPLSDKDINLDPSGDWMVAYTEILNIFYDSLYLISESGEVKPSLATSLPEISADGKTYKIELRSKAVFHDDPAFPDNKGRTVNTSDIIYSLKRIANPANETGLWSLISGRIEGLDEFRNNLKNETGDFNDEIIGLKAINPSELEIKLTKPFPQILYILAMPSFSIVAPEAVEYYGENFKQHAVGTGPFKLKSYESKQIVAERIPGHWRNPAKTEGELPNSIIFTLFDDPWNAFKNSELDILFIESRKLHAYLDDNFQIKKELAEAGYKVYPIKETARSFLIFNYNKPLFQNIHLRKTISHAIPWENIIDKEDILTASMIPESIPGYIEASWEYNPEKAKQELELAGYSQGNGLPELTFRIRWTTYYQILFAYMIEDALEEIGIKVKVELKDINELEDGDMKIQSWALDYPEASSILGLLYSKNLPPDGNNYGYFQNEEYDNLLDNQEYQKIAEFIIDNVIALPFRQTQIFYGLSPQIFNIKTDPLGYFLWSEIELSPQQND